MDILFSDTFSTYPTDPWIVSYLVDKGGGTNSLIFLNIGNTFGPHVFLGVVLYIKN